MFPRYLSKQCGIDDTSVSHLSRIRDMCYQVYRRLHVPYPSMVGAESPPLFRTTPVRTTPLVKGPSTVLRLLSSHCYIPAVANLCFLLSSTLDSPLWVPCNVVWLRLPAQSKPSPSHLLDCSFLLTCSAQPFLHGLPPAAANL